MPARTSNLRQWPEEDGNTTSHLPGHFRPQRFHGFVATVAIVLMVGTVAWAGNGPGLGLKIGAQTLESPITLKDTTRTRYEIELSSQVLLDGHLDFALSVGGSSLGTFESEYVDIIDDVLIEEYYSDSLSVIDLRLAARLYPFGDSRPIRPYLGAGVGYFWFLDSWEDEYYETIEDPLFPGTFLTFADSDRDTETLADGFFPFLLAGMTVPVGSNFEFLFEFKCDFEKEDSGFDLSGPIYMFGARFRF
ncbi:MAG: hypothetical protein JSW27_25960 [Phycisphaerales bacterium]|nr:MAG: hypothetical protein JSW27_25960 [Phycisphaerales bacterium]